MRTAISPRLAIKTFLNIKNGLTKPLILIDFHRMDRDDTKKPLALPRGRE
jgi:hypothetical protein